MSDDIFYDPNTTTRENFGFKERRDAEALLPLAVDPNEPDAIARARNALAARESRKRKLDHVKDLEEQNVALRLKLKKYKALLPTIPSVLPSEGDSVDVDLAMVAISTLQAFPDDIVNRASKVQQSTEIMYIRESFSTFLEKAQAIMMSTNDALETGVSPPTKRTLPKNPTQAQESRSPSVTETASVTQRSSWSKEETEKLVRLREDESGHSWEEIQTHFPGRSLNSLRQRYHRSRPKNQEGHWKKALKRAQVNDEANDEATITSAPQRWTEDNDRKLIDLVKGTNRLTAFEKLSKEFPGRSNRSLQRRHALLKPHVPTTPEIDIDSIDDDTLLEFLAEGNDTLLKKTPKDTNLLRIPLSQPTHQYERPSVILVARVSGNYVPKSWYGEHDNLEQGLQSWGAAQLADFQYLYKDTRPAVLHVGVNVKTAFFPTGADVKEHLTSDMEPSLKGSWRRAHRFTRQIYEDLENAIGRPTLISIGADGFTCNNTMLAPFLDRTLPFDLVTRFNFISYRDGNGPSIADPKLKRHDRCWWGRYSSEDILNAMKGQNLSHPLPEVGDLISFWADLQNRKDMIRQYHLVPGRNR